MRIQLRGLIYFSPLLLAVASCAILKSTLVNLAQPLPGSGNGSNGAIVDGKNKIPYFLPTGRLRIQMGVNEKTQECEMKVNEVYLPDFSQSYLLEYSPSIFSDDTVTIAISKTGLLTKVETKTKDQTPTIITQLAEIARAALRLPVAPSTRFLAKPCLLDQTYDPFDDNEPNEILKLIQAIDPNVSSVSVELYSPASSKNQSVNSSWLKVDSVQNGIVHRPLLPYKFTVKTKNKSVEPSSVVYLPNRSPILRIDIFRAPFVENQYALTFTDGILTEIKWVKPSEALGFLAIPVNLARTIASIPNELLTVKVQDLNAQKGVLEAQKNLIDAQLNLIRTQHELEAAK